MCSDAHSITLSTYKCTKDIVITNWVKPGLKNADLGNSNDPRGFKCYRI